MDDSFQSWVEKFDATKNCMCEILKKDKELEINEIVRRLATREESCMHSFSLDEPIITNFVRSEHNFAKRLNKVEI